MRMIKFYLLWPLWKFFSILWDHGGFRDCTGNETSDEEVFSKLTWYGKIGIKGFMWISKMFLTEDDWNRMMEECHE